MNFALDNIQKMNIYSPPLENRHEYKGELFDFNERTVSPSPLVLEKITDFLKTGKINLYPEYSKLMPKIADYAKVALEQVLLTNGAEQAIDLIFRTFTKQGDKVIFPVPTYTMINQFAQLAGNNIICPKYREDTLEFPFDDVINLISSDVKMVCFCNPNNPTGTLLSLEKIGKLLEKAKECNTLVFIDEAYFEFSNVSTSGFISNFPNLLVSRTFSKAFGLAGLRIGYLLTQKQNIDELLKVRGPYDINMIAVVGANAALDDIENTKNYVNEAVNISKPMLENYFRQKNIVFFKSEANFVLFKPTKPDWLFNKLQEKGFRCRKLNIEILKDMLRVTIGTRKQMEKFINALDSLN